jgi:hypothetical protein
MPDVILPVLDEAAARREPLLALGIEDRRSGWPLEMVLRAVRDMAAVLR